MINRPLGAEQNFATPLETRILFGPGADPTRRPLVRLNANGVADANFVTVFASPGTGIRDLAVLTDDCIVPVDARIYRFNAAGTIDMRFVQDPVTDDYENNLLPAAFMLAAQDSSFQQASGFG